MAKAKRAERVQVIADKRTWGAKPGAVAHPLRRDIDVWLEKGWHVDGAKEQPVEMAGDEKAQAED